MREKLRYCQKLIDKVGKKLLSKISSDVILY